MMTGADSIRRITPGIPLPARHAETSVKQSPAMMKTCPPHPVNRHRNKSRSTLILKAFLVALFLSAGAPWVPADDEEADAISDDPDVPAWLSCRHGGNRQPGVRSFRSLGRPPAPGDQRQEPHDAEHGRPRFGNDRQLKLRRET